MLDRRILGARRFLTYHTQDVIGHHSKFHDKHVGIKLARRESFHIHVSFKFAVELLAFSMGMIKVYDLFIRKVGTCPLGSKFYIMRKQELTMLIYCALGDFH